MDWLLEFQKSFREPVHSFIATFWPVIGAMLLMAMGWFVGSMLPRRQRDGGASRNDVADSDGDGGD